MEKPITTFVGCDLGDKHTDVCVLDLEGKVTLQTRIRTTREALAGCFRAVGRGRVIVEVGSQSRWVSELASALGHEVVVANARQVELISGRDRKTDRSDAMLLARLGRVDATLLRPVQHRAQAVQLDLIRLRARDLLVQVRTALINHVRGTVKSFGLRIRKCDTDCFARVATEAVSDELLQALRPVLDQIAALTAQIKGYEQWADGQAIEKYPQTARLTQVQGVGSIVALAFVLTLEDPGRFRKSRDVGAFLGLTAGKDQSGDHDPELGITKAGDPFLRRLLINSANYILSRRGHDSDLRRWGLSLAARGKKAAKKKATVAVARKLSVILHRLWVTGEAYQPLGHGRAPELAA